MPIAKLKELGKTITDVPTGFDIHKTVARTVEARRKMAETGEGLDWGMAEHLAFATLLDEGFPVRLSGQDSCRGTFTQRHSHFVDQTTEERYTPLNHICRRPGALRSHRLAALRRSGARLRVRLLARPTPNTLTLWEAQFGDFVNGAQVLIDQFISSGERKWLRMSGLVCCCRTAMRARARSTPPRASSASCSMCAEDNMQVVNCTTPANYFHALRRQMHRDFRKPLIVMTPKSLLRHKRAVSRFADMGAEHVLPPRPVGRRRDARAASAEVKLKADKEIRRVVMCSGKVYYDLFEEREKRKHRRRLPPAPRAALSVAGEVADEGARALPERRDGLVPGRAAEHGRLDLRRLEHRADAREAGREAQARPLCRPPRLGLDRRRPMAAHMQGTARPSSTRRSA